MPIVRGAPYGTASFAAMYGRYELQPRVGQDEAVCTTSTRSLSKCFLSGWSCPGRTWDQKID